MNKRFYFFITGVLFYAPFASWAQPDEAAFRQPPVFARPWVYWFWMDGNLSKEGITADFEAMAQAGIGGVLSMEVDVGVPRGPIKFMSAPWRALFKHAVQEAERLGLQITLNSGPGWTGSGGPWIDGEHSMQHLVASDTTVLGGRRFNATLRQPKPYPPFFGDGDWTDEMKTIYRDYYQDVAVLAFPALDEGHRIVDVKEKALYVRAPYSSAPDVKPSLPLASHYPGLPPGATIDPQKIVDLTGRLSANGQLDWQVPEGRWTILRFGATCTGANTRPAPRPGFGLECDKFSRKAFDVHWNAYIGLLLQEIGPRPQHRTTGWTMLHIDSWEMGSQNWTNGFRSEFQQRRGYDPLLYFPVLTGRIVGAAELSERFLWDLRQTAQELLLENHAGYLKELAHQNGFNLSIEPYDMNPTADLSLGGIADVPMCEFWARGYGFNTDYSCFEATSIAHTHGRPIVAAEAFTSDHNEAWKLHPGAMKAQADWAFCVGINRLAFHRYAHQPWLDRAPGMTMGPYGVHWERTQTWWPLIDGFHTYLARCQYLLQQGVAVADICLLTPEAAPYVFRPMALPQRGGLPDRPGYNFDGCAPEVLLHHAKVQNGRLQLDGGASYRLLVLPQTATMTPQLLHKIRTLIYDGAVVFGVPPKSSPSLAGYPECDQQVQKLVKELWGSEANAGERRLGKGRLIWSPLPAEETYPDLPMLESLFGKMNYPPDFSTDAPFRYTHRRVNAGELYFIANSEERAIKAACRFRVAGLRPSLWNPLTGTANEAVAFKEKKECTEIEVMLEPHGSIFIVFTKAAPRPRTASCLEPKVLQPVAGPWRVTFDARLGGPKHPVVFDVLQDWSMHENQAIRYYSGLATYSLRFDLPSMKRGRLWLDLGQVEVMAAVRLNGHELGTVWTKPYRIDISAAVQGKDNELEITVANLWPNRLIGDAALPAEKQIAWSTYKPFAADTPLLPSGLLGPVTLWLAEEKP
ncbi:MAG TPA: glycosyl hydrolase [bacterium]|nr:glycosyl hydrolase [bacterium]